MGAVNLTVGEQINFLSCFDGAKGTAGENTKSCAAAAKLDFSKISTCHNGDQVKQLMKTEGDYIVKRYPQLVGVPHIEIDHEEIFGPTYKTLLSALCAKGIKAGACKQVIHV